MTEQDILELICSDKERMSILEAVAILGMEDWWVGAGFVRNKVWDELFGNGKSTELNDVDIAYFKPLKEYGMAEDVLTQRIHKDEDNAVWDEEHEYNRMLSSALPKYVFECKNQARMHLWSGRSYDREPYTSAADAISDWVETATSLGVRIDESGELKLLACHGLDDLVNGVVRPTRPELEMQARQRMLNKRWESLWPGVRFENI